MNKEPMVSVIVPIYNVEKYLKRCIDSILNQTYKNLEIILIDDGSPDKCPEICDEYAQEDDRVIVIHKENGGVSSARNAGLDIAKGEYIGFVDPDDYINYDMYSTMVKKMELFECDAVICGFCQVSEKENKIIRKDSLENKIVSVEECFKELFGFSGLAIKPVVWNKLFKRDIISDLRFCEDIEISEDLLFCVEYLLNCDKIALLEGAFYNNFLRLGSATRSGAKAKSIVKTVMVDELVYRKIKFKYASTSDIVLKWTLEDNLGWYNELKKYKCSEELREMKKAITKRRYEVLFSKEIYWKQKILIMFGHF